MVQKKAHFFLGAVLFLAAGVSTTLGYVPDPQLWFDAKDNPDHPEGWTNLGTAGKKLVANDKGVPVLEPQAGPDGGPAYTAKEEGQSYGRNAWGIRHPEITPAPRVESWTIEVWLKRDGPAFDNSEHQILGIMDTPPWPRQAVLFFFEQPNNSKIFLVVIGREPGDDRDDVVTNIEVGLKEWHQVAVSYDNDEGELYAFMDGKQVGRPTKLRQKFSAESEMKNNSIFSTEFKQRVLNGSISIVRMYDRRLSEEEIHENFVRPRIPQAVASKGKLATTWGSVKVAP